MSKKAVLCGRGGKGKRENKGLVQVIVCLAREQKSQERQKGKKGIKGNFFAVIYLFF